MKPEFNPFSGVHDYEIGEIIVPDFDVDNLIYSLKSKDEFLVELNGKRGRGKTTHLKYIHWFFKNSSYIRVTHRRQLKEVLNHSSEFIFIDGIYHFNVLDRIRIFKKKKKLVYTCHRSMIFESFIASKKSTKFTMGGLDEVKLEAIITKRITLNSDTISNNSTILDKTKVKGLIRNYKDDCRAIINSLYDDYR